jgi:hypothetical protein
MAGRQAQGTWNAAFSAEDGGLVHSMDTKKRITHARFSAEGGSLVILAGANGQPQPKDGVWPKWGRLQMYRVEV